MRLGKALLVSGVIGFVVGMLFFVLAKLWVWNEVLSSIFTFLGKTIMWPVTVLYPFVLFNPRIIFPNCIMVSLNVIYFVLIGLIIWWIIELTTSK